MSNFFIMMNNQKGSHVMPIVDDENEVLLFETEEAARDCADEHHYCQAFGYEIFERGMGA